MVEQAPRSRGRYDAAVARSLPGLAAGLSVGCLVLGSLLVLAGTGSGRPPGVGAAALATLLLGGLSLVASQRGLPQRHGHAYSSAALLVAAVVAALPLVLEGDTRFAASATLVVATAGAALLDTRWLAGTVATVLLGTAATAAVVGTGAPAVLAATGPLLGAAALAAALHVLRRRGIDALLQMREAVREETVRDHLTAAVNHRGLNLLGTQMVESARRQGDAVHCIFVSVHELDVVTDTLGRQAADDVLISVADALRSSVRATDVVARWHGDDFCVLGPGPGMPPVELERRVRDYLKRRPPVDRRVWDPRVDTGGSMLAPWDSGSVETLLEQADREMGVHRAMRSRPAKGPSIRPPRPNPPFPPAPGGFGGGSPGPAERHD